MKRLRVTLLAVPAAMALVLLEQSAQAHGTATAGAVAGLSHPLLGLDHLLMLFSTGAAAAMLTPACLLWALGGAAVGAVLGTSGASVPYAELMASLGVAAVALLCLSRERSRQLWGLVIGAAVMVHAMLHGLEAPTGSQLWWWSGALISSMVVCLGSWVTVRALSTRQQRVAAVTLVASACGLTLVPLAQIWAAASA